MLELLAVLAVVGVLVVIASRRWWRPRTTDAVPAPVGWLAVVVLILGTGALAAALQFHGSRVPPNGSAVNARVAPSVLARASIKPTKRDALAAGRWVDEHAGPDDIVVTNLYCRYSRYSREHLGRPCDARNFIASAFTQRRTLVGGWAYADRVVAAAWTLRQPYRNAPFWNQPLLDENYTAFAHPTAAVLADLYTSHRVRWMYLDVRDGPVDTRQLDRLAIRRFTGPTTVVYQLRRPS